MKRIMLVIFAILMPCAVAAAQERPSCWRGLESIRGTYLVSYQGYLMIPFPGSVFPLALPGVIMGVISIDSAGNISGTATVAATEIEEYLVQGKVTLRPDCIGTIQLLATNKKTNATAKEEDKFIVLGSDDEMEIRLIMLDAGIPGVVPVVLGKWKRISRAPNATVW